MIGLLLWGMFKYRGMAASWQVATGLLKLVHGKLRLCEGGYKSVFIEIQMINMD